MFQKLCGVLIVAAVLGVMARAQNADAVQSYFAGKEVMLKIDMPGSQKGVDLRFNKQAPMDWGEYGSRIKEFGVSIRKGDMARVTKIVVKNDMIEFQLDGGGFGSFGDDTTTTVTAKTLDKSDYEKELERQISNASDDDTRRRLQRDLDRERSRRDQQNEMNRNDAAMASQGKAQQVAENRMRGGSRFNLRWQGSIPAGNLSPDALEKLLEPYVDFQTDSSQQNAGGPPPQDNGSAADAGQNGGGESGSPTGQLKRGMSTDEVARLLGQGNKLSETTSADGLKTQVYEYTAGDRHVEVTYVNGIVVKFAISSN